MNFYFPFHFYSNEVDNPIPTKPKTTRDSTKAKPQTPSRQGIRVTPNPNPNFHIPSVTSTESSLGSASTSTTSSKNNQSKTSSGYRYRPKTLNTASTAGDKDKEHATKVNTSISSKRPTSSRNEPVYATVGSVNSNQRLVKNLKSANVWRSAESVGTIQDNVDYKSLPSFEEVMI